jgi:hypothetical protein
MKTNLRGKRKMSKVSFLFLIDGFAAGWLRQRDGLPKILGNKFIKQVSSNSVDSHPKAEPQEQRGLSLHTIQSRLQIWGYSLSHTWSHIISLAIFTSGVRRLFSGLTPGAMRHSSNLVFLCFTVALIIYHYLPCLPATFSPLMIRPTSGSKSIILI